LDNSFGTCGLFDPHINLLNYAADIEIYGATTRAYRENRQQLMEGFYEVTDWRPDAWRRLA
jgi:hypothetical protein